MTIAAKIIADSIGQISPRLTTFELRYPRFIHAEELTHRILSTSPDMVETVTIPDGVMYDSDLSRNASSSRATPITSAIKAVQSNPAIPIRWGLNGTGMQDHGEMSEAGAAACEKLWLQARDSVLGYVGKMMKLPESPHKQTVNRLLEPWAHITVVVTATEWANFFALRRHEAAQPEIRTLADAMWQAMQESVPVSLAHGGWHLPYLELHELEVMDLTNPETLESVKKVSVARCARTSYKGHNGKPTTFDEDVALYDRLLGGYPLHASPAEHQATPDVCSVVFDPAKRKVTKTYANPEKHGNLRGWIQHRKCLPGENIATYEGA
jgi:hypothetical protein